MIQFSENLRFEGGGWKTRRRENAGAGAGEVATLDLRPATCETAKMHHRDAEGAEFRGVIAGALLCLD